MPSWKAAGPISLHGFGRRVKVDPEARVRLTVAEGSNAVGSVHPQDAAALGLCSEDVASGCQLVLQLADGSDCLVPVRIDTAVNPGAIHLDSVSQFNLRIASGHKYEFSVFVPPDTDSTTHSPLELVDMDVELRLLCNRTTVKQSAALSSSDGTVNVPLVQVDGAQVASHLSKHWFQRMVAVNEVAVVQCQHGQVVARVTCVNNLNPTERAEAVSYHCFRGVVTADTAIFTHAQGASGEQAGTSALTPETRAGTLPNSGECAQSTHDRQSATEGRTQAQEREAAEEQTDAEARPGLLHALNRLSLLDPQAGHAAGSQLQLVNVRVRPPEREPRDVVYVHCCDGEVFHVKRKVLRPAIALTAAVRSTEAAPSVTVNVPTLVFDRVLIFLEAIARGCEPPSFAVHLLEDLLAAAQTLQILSLQRACEDKLGRLQQQLRVWAYAEVVAANAAGRCLLIMDGMVLDVTKWLPEHPGGSTIIPQQALNMDSSRFYEVYHSSRESFLYLKEFYVGELCAGDLNSVPHPPEAPSDDFVAQLRSYTAFRLSPQDILAMQQERQAEQTYKVYKSF